MFYLNRFFMEEKKDELFLGAALTSTLIAEISSFGALVEAPVTFWIGIRYAVKLSLVLSRLSCYNKVIFSLSGQFIDRISTRRSAESCSRTPSLQRKI